MRATESDGERVDGAHRGRVRRMGSGGVMKRRRRAWAWAGLLTIVALIILATEPTEVQQRFRILVTNDDGIETAGIQTLAESLRSVADEVVVVAPDGNRSGSSQATSGEPLVVREFRDGSRSLGYGVSGFPADAVRFGLIELGGDRGFDLVVSGINVGSNVGNVSHLSGTVGAAMEAIFQGVPAIAVSQEAGDTNYTLAADFVTRLVEQLESRGFPEGVVLSVNVPSGMPAELRGVTAARMGGSYLRTMRYERQNGSDDRRATYLSRLERVSGFEPGTDSYAYEQGQITVTPLRFDWSDRPLVDELNRWGLTIQ